MNRLGMVRPCFQAPAPKLDRSRPPQILDVSHTDPSTASDALTHSLSPPIFSHSNARGVHNAVRNVPDSILRRIGATSKKSHCHQQPAADLSLDGEGGEGWGSDNGEAGKPVPSGALSPEVDHCASSSGRCEQVTPSSC